MLGFLLCDALLGLYCSCLQVLYVRGSFCLEFCLQHVKCMLDRVEIRWLTCPLQNIPLLCFKKTPGLLLQYVLGHCPCVKWSAVQLTSLNLAESEQTIYSHTIHLIASSVTSPITTSDPVPLEAMHAHAITLPPPCFTDDEVCFGSRAVPIILVQFDLSFICPKNAWSGLFRWFFFGKI